MRVRLLACAVIVALTTAACGADDVATSAEPASTGTDVAASDAPASPSGDVPDLDMVSVYTGETVNLQSLVSGETPLLLWFWAPH
ncbi:MAG: hypothetical protein F4126_02570 [Acidimicrobiaceae bacterium]|nr:hypothetical protein [Acidimicrobiaceae bacterium]MYB87389.1 hypothetical protein [Acidimicrobiaceae bacterium]MYH92578.1 hypothetical protein [Acidimicrobiaceae bacterium]